MQTSNGASDAISPWYNHTRPRYIRGFFILPNSLTKAEVCDPPIRSDRRKDADESTNDNKQK